MNLLSLLIFKSKVIIYLSIAGGNTAIVNLIYGTGKWKGITGSGKFEVISRGKSMELGTFHGCVRDTGTFELPKK
jgi:hypothetical protein